MACVAVASLLRTIELEFLQSQLHLIVRDNDLISRNKELIRSLHKKLGFLIEIFDEKRIDGVEAIKHLETKLKDLALRVEDEIEFQLVDLYEDKTLFFLRFCQIFHQTIEKSHPYIRLHHILQQAIEDIDSIKEELVKIKNRYVHGVDDRQGRKNELDALPKSVEVIMMEEHASHSNDIMVRKNDEFKTIEEMLVEHPSKQQEVVSIKGMGGIGKTTLARRVYEDLSIVTHFDVRAWVVASQLHNKRQMLIGLLSSISQQSNVESSTDENLALNLYQHLKCQRYLVVIDEVWSGEAWDDVRTCFPNDGNGSRVLLTTRLAKVANYIGSNNDFSHQMQLLDQSKSWNLFREKACKSHGAKFEIIGRPIVEKCKGLPLAIVVVVGLFSKLNTLNEWEDIANALNSFAITTIAPTCSNILSLSCNHLLHDLKACFLYLGIFPEDHEIDANNLARLWAAEGLVKASENESFDVVAKRHIQELMDRNLILVSKRSCCRRKIKAFRVHDLLLAFCAREAQNENFYCLSMKMVQISLRNVSVGLPRLEVLKLFDFACVGQEWELLENEKFCQYWKASGVHFPKLEHLLLYSCKKLEEIPSGFAEISKLKSIKLTGCLPSVVTSAEEIKEEQLDYLNNIVDVVITKQHDVNYFETHEILFDELESNEYEFVET